MEPPPIRHGEILFLCSREDKLLYLVVLEYQILNHGLQYYIYICICGVLLLQNAL
jgi:hypothetical protein